MPSTRHGIREHLPLTDQEATVNQWAAYPSAKSATTPSPWRAVALTLWLALALLFAALFLLRFTDQDYLWAFVPGVLAGAAATMLTIRACAQ